MTLIAIKNWIWDRDFTVSKISKGPFTKKKYGDQVIGVEIFWTQMIQIKSNWPINSPLHIHVH